MDEQPVEREYPYHYGREFLGCFLVAAFLLAVASAFAFYWAITSSDPVEVRKGLGRVELTGTAAKAALAACGAVGLLCMLACLKAARTEAQKASRPRQRVAFFPAGIKLPRDMEAEEEEYVEYADISRLETEWLEHQGGRSVTFLHFVCSRGRFSIARRKLTAQAFDEICAYLQDKVDRAPRKSAQTSTDEEDTRIRERSAPGLRSEPVQNSRPGVKHVGGRKICPACGKSLSVYAVKCRDCGAEV
jgi:hypothetical protein